MQHILSTQQFDREFIDSLFSRTKRLQEDKLRAIPKTFPYVLATLFYEPSTRTRLSFEAAMCRLGGKCISVENGKESSSGVKGETIEDTIKTISQYADVIVMRHPEEGSAEKAAKFSDVPLINGGDGPGEHPTQALIDLYTIWRERKVDKLQVAVLGDPEKARAVKSICHLLTNLYRAKVEIVSCLDDMNKIKNCDVLYMTRIQKERYKEKEEKPLSLALQKEILESMKPDAMILHPLPRQEELPVEVDSDPRAAYWKQVKNGMFLRMALLERVLVRK